MFFQNTIIKKSIKAKSESVSNEDQITQQLYKDYSAFKRELFANILANNPPSQKPSTGHTDSASQKPSTGHTDSTSQKPSTGH